MLNKTPKSDVLPTCGRAVLGGSIPKSRRPGWRQCNRECPDGCAQDAYVLVSLQYCVLAIGAVVPAAPALVLLLRLVLSMQHEYRSLQVFPRIVGEDLFTDMNRRFTERRPYTENEVRSLMRPVCEAVHEMHKVNIFHRDIKPEVPLY